MLRVEMGSAENSSEKRWLLKESLEGEKKAKGYKFPGEGSSQEKEAPRKKLLGEGSF
jgi:hypothetical protein